VKYKEEK